MFEKLKRAAEGASVPHRKNTSEVKTDKMPVPQRIYLAMQQHIGAPAAVCVQKGDKVFVGSVVGKSGGFVSSDIHSGVSGTVFGIDNITYANGAKVPCVVIDTDGEQTVLDTLAPPVIEDHKTFLDAIRASGLVGLGGAGFPTAVKLSPKNLEDIDYLVINGAECEPYITSDNREFLENPDFVMSGVMLVKRYLSIKNVVIAIENNKPEAIELMTSLAQGDKNITVMPLESKYPQGAEKILIERVTGREVPQGGLPSDVGVIVLNVATVSFIAKFMQTGMPLTTKRLTVDGDAMASPKNVEVIVGTPIQNVIDFCGGASKPVAKVITGGPMMGLSVANTAFPILKQNNAILVFTEKLAVEPKETACVRCGRCVNGCPMGLSAVELVTAFKKGDAAELTKLKVDLCMECGCCSFICPARKPLVQSIKLAKILQRTGGK